MDPLRAMQVFRAVADSRSFTQAAQQLGMPRPTVTNTVQAIEQQLGVRLLHRTTRKVSLTAEGTLYLERCRSLLHDYEELNGLFAGEGRKLSGSVRVELPERVAQLTVIPALPAFFRRYPDIHVHIGASDRYADLVGEGIDCAVRGGVLRDSSLVARPLGEVRQVSVASRAYLAEHGRPQSVDELAAHWTVGYFSTVSGRPLPWEYVDADGVAQQVAMRSRVTVGSTLAYIEACRAGLGMIQLPVSGLGALLESGELEEVLPAWRPAPMPVSIVYAHNRHLSPRVRLFVDWLAELLAAQPA